MVPDKTPPKEGSTKTVTVIPRAAMAMFQWYNKAATAMFRQFLRMAMAIFWITILYSNVLLQLYMPTCSTYKTRELGKIVVSLKYTLNTRTTVLLVIVQAYILTNLLNFRLGSRIHVQDRLILKNFKKKL